MKDVTKLEQEILRLPHAQRERLAMAVWSSLEQDMADGLSDADGIALALERDREIESGTTSPIDHTDFRRRTGGAGSHGS